MTYSKVAVKSQLGSVRGVHKPPLCLFTIAPQLTGRRSSDEDFVGPGPSTAGCCPNRRGSRVIVPAQDVRADPRNGDPRCNTF